jgi:hypothetical protein
VTVAAPKIAVAVSPQSVVVFAGQLKQFTASVTGDNTGVTWSVNGISGGNNAVGTIDSTGNYTAPVVATNAIATVAATSKTDATKTGRLAVTGRAKYLSRLPHTELISRSTVVKIEMEIFFQYRNVFRRLYPWLWRHLGGPHHDPKRSSQMRIVIFW